MHPEEQREAWIHRRAEWWAHRRIEQSSEDVWDMREYVPHLPIHVVGSLTRVRQQTIAKLS